MTVISIAAPYALFFALALIGSFSVFKGAQNNQKEKTRNDD